MTENDRAWERFFEQSLALDEIRQQGFCYVNANELKQLGNREPRLMAKLDTRSVRPKVFKDQKLSIFPVRNGEYIVFADPEDKTYFELSADHFTIVAETYRSAVNLRAFDSFPGSPNLNESQAIDFAYISSLLTSFTGDPDIRLAIRGRLYSGKFSFRLPGSDHLVDVEGVQIEIDAGYESTNAIYLIEAKVGSREDFHIRQLYYPYLEWSTKSKKRIVPIFLTYTNGKYYLTEFSFDKDFGDLAIVRNQCYVIDESPNARVNLKELLQRITEEIEPVGVPFPQADDMDKVVDLVSSVEQGVNTKILIAEYFEFDKRQSDYYANAAIYLGLLARQPDSFALTDLGETFVHTKSLALRTEILLIQMTKWPTFRSVLTLLALRGYQTDSITKSEISNSIAQFTKLTGSTLERRALTVRSWLQWILRNCDIVV